MGDFLQNSWLALLLTAAAAYLLGSINSAIIVTRLFAKEDIRSYGSGNAGATNMMLAAGLKPGLVVMALDVSKAFVAVLLGGFLLTNLSLGQPSVSSYLAPFMLEENLRLVGQYLAGFFCIIGHLFPLYFGFRGGKGVLTTLGWKVALLSLLMFIIGVLISRMVSLGSICAAATMAVLTYVFRMFVYKQDASTVIFCTCMAVLIAAILIIKHIPNIKRIAKGTESKLSFGKK